MQPADSHFAVSGLAAIEFAGPETKQFLQGQLTADIDELAPDAWAWAGYCTPQGKLLCTALAWPTGADGIGLVLASDLREGVARRLSMYVLRAKTKLSDPAGTFAGCLDSSLAAGRTEADEAGSRSFGLGNGLALRWGPPAEDDPARERQWWRALIEAGAPLLSAATGEQLTPQAASLDLAGGVSFTKGCYVGQEIVARTRHLGKVKKRAFVVSGPGDPPPAGSSLLLPEMRGQAGGTVIRAAQAEEGFIGLASLRIDAAGQPIALEDGRSVAAAEPPYGAAP